MNTTLKTTLKSLTLLMVIFLPSLVIAQTWTHDFETSGGYSTSVAECNDGSQDFFARTDDAGIGLNPAGEQGSYYFGGSDMDGAPCANITASLTFDDIDISGCSGLSLTLAAATTYNQFDTPDYVDVSVDIDNTGSFTTILSFRYDGTDGTNDPILVDTDFDGVGDGSSVGATFSDFTAAIAGTGSVMDIKIEFRIDHGSEDFYVDNLRLNGTGCSSGTSILTGAVSTSPFIVECSSSTNATGTLDFTSSGTFNAGNVYTAQLSDASGSFTNPTNIGTLTSTSNSGTIGITIPYDTDSGTGYLIRVISDNPATEGTSSAAVEVSQLTTCPITLPGIGLVINEWSNGSAGNQEYYEFVVTGECGESVDIRGYILDDNNGTFTAPASYDGTASGIAPGHFRFTNDAQWSNIPVGSVIVVYNANEPNGDLPAADPTDSNNDSLYVVPHTSTLFERCTTYPTSASPDSIYAPCTYSTATLTGWNPLSLRNSGDAIQVRTPSGSYYHGVSYGGAEMTGGPNGLKLFTGSGTGQMGWFNDGNPADVSSWGSGSVTGNQTPGDANNAANLAWLQAMRDTSGFNCPVVLLPVEMGDFRGAEAPEGNVLYWNTLSERKSDYFIIQRSIDGKTWVEVGQVNSAGTSQELNHYQLVDVSFSSEINYYRLIQVDEDGTKTKFARLVSIDNTENEDVELIGIYNLVGQKVDANFNGVQIRVYSDGTTQRVYKY